MYNILGKPLRGVGGPQCFWIKFEKQLYRYLEKTTNRHVHHQDRDDQRAAQNQGMFHCESISEDDHRRDFSSGPAALVLILI